jgi:hypothetical protein
LLRKAHLKYHPATRALFTEPQSKRYAELGGYGGEPPHHTHHQQ